MLSYVLAFFAGLVNATGNVLNRKAAREEPDQAEFRLKLITDLMHRKVWLAAVGLMIISFALAAAALGTGQLASVQLEPRSTARAHHPARSRGSVRRAPAQPVPRPARHPGRRSGPGRRALIVAAR